MGTTIPQRQQLCKSGLPRMLPCFLLMLQMHDVGWCSGFKPVIHSSLADLLTKWLLLLVSAFSKRRAITAEQLYSRDRSDTEYSLTQSTLERPAHLAAQPAAAYARGPEGKSLYSVSKISLTLGLGTQPRNPLHPIWGLLRSKAVPFVFIYSDDVTFAQSLKCVAMMQAST